MLALPAMESAPLLEDASTMIDGLIVIVLVLALLARKLLLPEYDASMVCAPGGKLAVLSDADPLESVTEPKLCRSSCRRRSRCPSACPSPEHWR